MTASLSTAIAELQRNGIPCDSSESALAAAARDASQLKSAPLLVVRPESAEQVADTVKICTAHALPVTVAGGYTGLSGGALGHGAVRIETQQMHAFTIGDGTVRAQAGASVPEIIRQSAAHGFSFPFQPASACRTEDAYEYLGTRVGPVTIGGSLGANASGLVGCKLGAAAAWVRELLVVLPDGTVETVTEGFERFVGTEGRYGIIVEATIALAEPASDLKTFLVSGIGVESFTAAAVAIGQSGTMPLMAEAMVMSGAPPDFDAIARSTLDDAEVFLQEFGAVFQPSAWLIILQGDDSVVDTCLPAVRASAPDIAARELSESEFVQIKQMRSAASDAIGQGVVNPARLDGERHPVQRASRFLADAIRTFQQRGMRPKAEHNLGMLRVFIEDTHSREAYRRDVEQGAAFDDGTLALYRECGEDLETLFASRLSPIVTDDMLARKEAVNFPGNEDILVRAEQFPDTIVLLGSMMETYKACPVPLYYCHIGFRRNPEWILLHNRLLMDVAEFG